MIFNLEMNLLLMNNLNLKFRNIKECEPLMCFVDKFIYFMSLLQKHLFYVFRILLQLLRSPYEINNNFIINIQGYSNSYILVSQRPGFDSRTRI